jgi:sensor histidine kinase YesM
LDSQAKDHVGLSNLRLRLQQHYGPRARFSLDPMESGGARAEIRLAEAT